MHKKFEINQTKIKGGCQSGREVVPHDSKSNLPLVQRIECISIMELSGSIILAGSKKSGMKRVFPLLSSINIVERDQKCKDTQNMK